MRPAGTLEVQTRPQARKNEILAFLKFPETAYFFCWVSAFPGHSSGAVAKRNAFQREQSQHGGIFRFFGVSLFYLSLSLSIYLSLSLSGVLDTSSRLILGTCQVGYFSFVRHLEILENS